MKFQVVNSFCESLAEKLIDLSADTLSIRLSGSAGSAAVTTVAGISELSTANGYTAGGIEMEVASASRSGYVYSVVGNTDPEWTASGAGLSIASVWLIDDTANVPIGFFDYSKSVAAGDSEKLNGVGKTILTVTSKQNA